MNQVEAPAIAPMFAHPRAPSSRSSFLLLWLIFVVYSLCHAPIPSVNEPHYLTKAKNYWNPRWGQGDFFLQSTNAHLVFFQTIGWLTKFLSLAQTAFVGRFIGYGLLAFSWNRLATRIVLRPQAGVISGVVFLLIASIVNLSGEWVVGGIEGKVLAYGFVLLGYSSAFDRRWLSCGACFGLATAFHPLVGMWNVTAIGLAALVNLILPDRGPDDLSRSNLIGIIRDRSFLLGVIVFAAFSAWGIWPALRVVGGATDRETFVANYVQVFHRLSHHLDPMMISVQRYVIYVLLTVAACIGTRWARWSGTSLWFQRVVLASGLIAVVGLLLGLRTPGLPGKELVKIPFFELRMTLLKFYPFRLFDALLPILVSILVAHLVTRRLVLVDLTEVAKKLFVASIFGLCLILGAGVGSNKHLDDIYVDDWKDVCRWVDQHLPADVVVMTPKDAWAFKWFAQRAEFVNGKDCPQDPKGIAQWNNRLLFLSKWAQDNLTPKGYSREACSALTNNRFQKLTHIITRRLGPLDLPIIYSNTTFTVYQAVQPPSTSKF